MLPKLPLYRTHLPVQALVREIRPTEQKEDSWEETGLGVSICLPAECNQRPKRQLRGGNLLCSLAADSPELRGPVARLRALRHRVAAGGVGLEGPQVGADRADDGKGPTPRSCEERPLRGPSSNGGWHGRCREPGDGVGQK